MNNILLIRNPHGWFDIPSCGFIIDVCPFESRWTQAVSHKLSQVSPLDQVTYLLLQLETIFCVMAVILVKLIIFVLVSPEWVSLHLPRPFHELLILNFHKYLSNGGVEMRQHEFCLARSSYGASVVVSLSRIHLGPSRLRVALVIYPP
ncbi:hypothetical protein Acr_12g0001770 [Actinidia rufa]|uniref:Uncharacterized protein n=1 Tax=Actinidia rufa TaxID=165716 RepID=A0A7J0FGS5_9ERIC|nr:hypothetical protein Acr_12g0001770 [Actinidia rufa]